MDQEKFKGHTPRPWKVVKGLCLYVTAPSIPETVMIITGRNDAEAEANVHLIAAAPDLLVENQKLREFARAVIRYAGNAGDDYLADKAREALKEADQ
jgi:hypothetical protein